MERGRSNRVKREEGRLKRRESEREGSSEPVTIATSATWPRYSRRGGGGGGIDATARFGRRGGKG